MDLCVWIINVNNCNYSSILTIIVYVGLFISSILFMVYTYMFYIRIYNYGIKSNIKYSININFYELLFVSAILIFIFRILYLVSLLKNFNKILIMFLENMSYAILSIYENLLIAILSKFILQKSDVYVISFKINVIWILITFIMTMVTSLVSGYLFHINNIKLGYTILGIHFIIHGFQMLIFSVISYYYDKNFVELIKQNITNSDIANKNNINTAKNNLNKINMLSIIAGSLFGILWVIQGIWMILNYISYESNLGWIMFVSIFWYFGGFMSVFTLYLLLLSKNIF